MSDSADGRLSSPLDCWAAWLLHRRQGGDDLPADRTQKLKAWRDQVLEKCELSSGDCVLDVGCGDGLIGFGALEQLDETGRVIFADISGDLLTRCRQIASDSHSVDRCEFLHASADDLSPIPDGSVDVVTTRAVLIYVADKRSAFHEFHRVLKAGGRLSVLEPINRFTFPEPAGFFYGYDLRRVEALLVKVRAVYDQYETAVSSMLDFDERDLLHAAEEARFAEVHLAFRVDIETRTPEDPARFVRSSGNPLVPTLEEAIGKALTVEEREQFLSQLRPLVQGGEGTYRMAIAHLWARKTSVTEMN